MNPFDQIQSAAMEIRGKLDTAERALERLRRMCAKPMQSWLGNEVVYAAAVDGICEETLGIIRR